MIRSERMDWLPVKPVPFTLIETIPFRNHHHATLWGYFPDTTGSISCIPEGVERDLYVHALTEESFVVFSYGVPIAWKYGGTEGWYVRYLNTEEMKEIGRATPAHVRTIVDVIESTEEFE